MKKVFQIKLKNITKVFALVMATSLVTFTGCKSYDEDISGLQTQIDLVVTDVAGLKTSVAALQSSVNGMTYIKSITMGTDGKLTITPSTGSAIVYDAKTYVTYDISLTGNNLMVNGVNKGTVAIPALTFGADNKLMSGTTVVADLSGWVRTLTLSADNYLTINGTKSTILIPTATVQSVDVKGITISGNVLTITKNDGTTSTITLPATAIVTSTGANGHLLINGVDTGVMVANTFTAVNGFLYVNGVATTVPISNGTSVILNKVDGVVVSTTITDKNGATATIKVNPSTELLAGLLFVPEWIDGGVNAVELGFIVDTTRTYNTNGTVIGGASAPYGSGNVKALFAQQDINFRFNPTSVDLSKTTWKFVNNSARLTAPGVSNAPGDATTLFAAPTYTPNNDGSGKFSLKVGTWVEPAAGKTHLFALQANGTDFYSGAASQVVSDYVKVATVAYNAFISNAKTSVVSTNTYNHYRTAVPAIGDANDFGLVADNSIVTDLDELVLATANKGGALEKTFAAYGFGVAGIDYKYEFSLPTYLGLDGVTNQNSFVTLNPTTNVLTVNQGTSPIDRNPLVTVKLKTNSGKLLAQAYIKFRIVPKVASTVEYAVPAVSLTYPALFVDAVAGVSAGDVTDVILTWANINNYIYNPLGLTHNEFQAKYGGVTPTVAVTVNGTAVAGATLAQYPLIRSMLAPDVDTYAMKYQVTPYAKFGTTVITYTFNTGVASDDKVKISFTFTVAKPNLDKTILAGYQVPGSPSDMLTQGTNYGSGYAMQIYLGEGFAYGSTALRAVFGVATANKIDGALHQLTFKVGAKGSYQTGASLNGTDIPTTANATSGATAYPAGLLPVVGNGVSLDAAVGTGGQTGTLMALTSALTVPEKVYNMNFYTYYPNAEKDSTAFNVHFKNPLTIVEISPLNPGFTLTDVITGQVDTLDVAPNYNVMFGTKIAIKGGVAQTANTTTTVKASDFNIAVSNLAYAFSTTGYSYAGISLAGGSYAPSVLQWINNGTSINTTVPVATIKPAITTPYAVATKDADVIYVKSSSAPGFIKRK